MFFFQKMNEKRLMKYNEGNKKFIPFKIGFQNSNNLCYMNSILTCLCQVKEFMLKFGSRKLYDFVILLEDRSIFKTLYNVIRFFYENKDFLNLAQDSIVFAKNIFRNGEQSDANEFLVLLLSWLITEETHLIINSMNVPNVKTEITASFNACLTFLNDEFKIRMRQKIVCARNGCVTNAVSEEIINLNVINIQSGQYFRNINACIEHFFQPVLLKYICPSKIHRTTNNRCTAFYCDACLQYVDAQKQ
jgi:uncharacterized UBP type Zn finger protein